MKKEKMQSKNLIAVGDLVRILPIDAKEGSIVWIEERYSSLSRQDISGKKEQLIAVNIDQVLIVSSLILPPLKTRAHRPLSHRRRTGKYPSRHRHQQNRSSR